MRLFDCHCHPHMSPRGIAPLLETIPQSPPSSNDAASSASFAGAAIMSTHPRDYDAVDLAASRLREGSYRAVSCYGIHPWFLHEVLRHDSAGDADSDSFDDDGDDEDDWLVELRKRLVDNPDAIVGEIGLDGARWREAEDNDDDAVKRNGDDAGTIWERKRILSCPMESQRRAFEEQLLLAAELQRPASIHVVRAWGELLDSFGAVRDEMKRRRAAEESDDGAPSSKRRKTPKRPLLPPKIYFHAFSGKAGVVPSILAACEKGRVPREDVFFGFAPAIPNYYSPKTPSIMRTIGIRQLVLETDLEDASNMWDDLRRGVEGLATALDVDAHDVAEQTYRNAERLYFRRVP